MAVTEGVGKNKDTLKRTLQENERFINFYIFLYILFIFANVKPTIISDLILMLIILFFILAKKKILFMMYIFFIIWDDVLLFNYFNISCGLIVDLICVVRLVFLRNQKMSYQDIILLFYFTIYAILFFISSNTLTGFAILVEIMIVMSFHRYENKEESNYFWECTFFTIMISVLLSGLYGYINGALVDRYITSLGEYIVQSKGTTSTSRLGIYSICGMIYPIFYMHNKIIKLLIIVTMLVILSSTISLTAIIGLLLFLMLLIVFMQSKEGKIDALKKRIITIFFILLVIYIVIHNFHNNRILMALISRVDTVINRVKIGDLTYATSGRTNLWSTYFNFAQNMPIFKKFFGSGYLNIMDIINTSNYSHFTYLDIFISYGFIGLFLFIYLFIKSVIKRKDEDYFFPVLLMKTMVFFVGMSTSLLTNPDWLVLMLL